MATEYRDEVTEGGLGTESILIDCVADELIPMWSPVIVVAAGTGEDLPRVEPNNTAQNQLVLGVAVGPLIDVTNGRCASAAGDIVWVCVFGRCKVKVDGNAGAIAIGDALTTHDADGVAQLAGASTITHCASIFAMALKASTADGDIIPCFVNAPAQGILV